MLQAANNQEFPSAETAGQAQPVSNPDTTAAQLFVEAMEPLFEESVGERSEQIPMFPAKVRQPPDRRLVEGYAKMTCTLVTGAIVPVWGRPDDAVFMNVQKGQNLLLHYDSETDAYAILRTYARIRRGYEWTPEQLTEIEILSKQVAQVLATCSREYQEAISQAFVDAECPLELDARTVQAGGVSVMIQVLKMIPFPSQKG